MPSSRSPSPEIEGQPPAEDRAPEPDQGGNSDHLRRSFVEALRRAEIVSLVHAAESEEELGRTLAEELCEVFDAEIGFVIDGGSSTAVPRILSTVGLNRQESLSLLQDPSCIEALRGSRATVIAGSNMHEIESSSVLMAPFSGTDDRSVLIGVARLYDEPFDAIEVALIEAVTESAGHAMERLWAYGDRDRRAAEQLALVRAAKTLNRSLDIEEVLSTLCREAREGLGADEAVAYLGNESDGYAAVGISGLPESYRGHRRGPGEGLGAQAVRSGQPKVTHAYQQEGYAPQDQTSTALRDIRAGVSVPLRWNDQMRGFVSVGFTRERRISAEDVELVEGFAELAALACGNAERHAAVREAADKDALTGCLNQSAFRRALRRTIATAVRDETALCLVLLDLDGFKEINDTVGHPTGDGVLREVGEMIDASIRDEDVVARFGGDEFAIILTDLGEEESELIVRRLVRWFRDIDVPVEEPLSACAGVAALLTGEGAKALIERADGALLGAKRNGKRGAVQRADGGTRAGTSGTARRTRPAGDRRRRRDMGHRLQALAGRIGLKVARQHERIPAAKVAAAELAAALEATECTVLRLGDDGRATSLAHFNRSAQGVRGISERAVGRCMRERRPVLNPAGLGRSELRTAPHGELAVPVITGDAVWGAIACRADGDPFGPEDAKLTEAVAEHLGTTMRAIELNEDLKLSLIGTAESLAAALAAKDSYTAEHARTIAELAVAVGRELELDERELDDLRYGGIFHDIGKIAIPDAILNKEGPLTGEEFELVKRHTLVGEEILTPVPLFSRVRRIVRHDHEHWNGSGYPDGLRGTEIPLGARIVLVADAYSAMTSDRPYRAGMSHQQACEELRVHAGTQFDPGIVDAFMNVAEQDPGLLRQSADGYGSD